MTLFREKIKTLVCALLVWSLALGGLALAQKKPVEPLNAVKEYPILIRPDTKPGSPESSGQEKPEGQPLATSAPLFSSEPELAVKPPARPKSLVGQKCSLRLIAMGDILTHVPLRKAATLDDGSFDFKPFFEYVAPLFKQGDLVIGNLETPLAGAERGYSGYPSFNVPAELAANLKEVGLTTVVLANNHALDRSWRGLAATIANVEKAGLDYAGAYAYPKDKSQRLISVYNGIMVAVLAYSYGFNGIPGPAKKESWRLGYLENDEIMEDILAARSQGADFVIVNLHFGEEYQRLPNKFQKELAERVLEGDPAKGLLGADIILGHHPHVVQPYLVEVRRGQSQLAIFSLGNFISNQFKPYTNLGLILDCVLAVDENGQKAILDIQLIPTICQTFIQNRQKTYRVMPMASVIDSPETFSFLKKNELKKMAQQKADLEKLLLALMEPKTPPADPPARAPKRAKKKPSRNLVK
ncbi:MAG: CapA family protein [Deltaproteobacteria bacterium]|jgi:poly-gamma-glutamate synthesis protein (capsule biosynthesis protein)|nr:CapA family protein [Deltaproteobacteria bacterium]